MNEVEVSGPRTALPASRNGRGNGAEAPRTALPSPKRGGGYGGEVPRTALPSPRSGGGNGGGVFRTALPSPKKGGGGIAPFPNTTPPKPKNGIGGAFPSTTPPMPMKEASPFSGNDSSNTSESATPPTTRRQNGKRNGVSPHNNGWTPPTNSSPHVARRLEPAMSATSHTQHLTLLICNSLWGQKLTFHPFTMGDKPVMFSNLWPDQETLVDTYKDAELNKRPYDLCKLLLAGQCVKALEALLDQKVSSSIQRGREVFMMSKTCI